MKTRKLPTILACCSALMLFGPAAWAQDDEESDDSDDSEQAEEASASASGSWNTSGATATANTTADTTTAAEAPPRPLGASDHDAFVGSYGIGFLGFRTMSIAGSATDPTAVDAVDAPVIGVRYWMDRDMGLDLGLGLSWASASATVETPAGETEVDAPEPFAFILHAGIPLALASRGHFVFQVTPELNLGYATNTIEVGDDELSVSGLHLDIGVRAGAEVHFGFIDIPQLSLQAGIGVQLAYDSVSAELGDNSVSASRTSFGTTVGDDPWDIFAGSITAIYYFDQ